MAASRPTKLLIRCATDGEAMYALAAGEGEGGDAMYTLAAGAGEGGDAMYALASDTGYLGVGADDGEDDEEMYALASGDNGQPASDDEELEPMYTLASSCKGIVSARLPGAETAAEKATRQRLARDQMLTLPTRGDGVYTIDKKLRSSTDTTFDRNTRYTVVIPEPEIEESFGFA